MVGYDNERGKGDHKHIGNDEFPYEFIDVATLIEDFREIYRRPDDENT
ncbi:toxin-antitoxin system TumE family protein [Methylomonas paludis]